jgi:hypothetical protein
MESASAAGESDPPIFFGMWEPYKKYLEVKPSISSVPNAPNRQCRSPRMQCCDVYNPDHVGHRDGSFGDGRSVDS